MSFVTEQPIGLIEKLRISERLASHIIREDKLHAEPKYLRLALASDGTTVHAVLKNWIFSLVETQPDQFHNLKDGERFIERELREKMLEAFPKACNL